MCHGTSSLTARFCKGSKVSKARARLDRKIENCKARKSSNSKCLERACFLSQKHQSFDSARLGLARTNSRKSRACSCHHLYALHGLTMFSYTRVRKSGVGVALYIFYITSTCKLFCFRSKRENASLNYE